MTAEIADEILNAVPARVAAHYTVFPAGIEQGVLRVLVPEDLGRELKDELGVALGRALKFEPVPRRLIEDSIAKFYGIGAGVIEALTLGQQASDEEGVEVIDTIANQDPTITTLVNELFMDALKHRASDIHLEPFAKRLRIRYRVDGILQDARISEGVRILAPNLISRIKIMAALDIGEKRLPQDGRIKIRQGAEELDLRVSVLPSSFGEAVVVRILKSLELLSLEDLGFDPHGTAAIRGFLSKPHGIVLITGPTGSGKTTTLYACLKELNQTERKIVTVEDPVEYKLPGVLQMQVNPKIKFTFVPALRAILRHDPDCIMIGEIRDFETAQIAVRAALTGHLVFSTLHTNDAPSALTRLVEMGVEPYLAASALEGVIAQRLVRRYGRDGEFHGRLAIAEIMPLTDEIRDLVLERKAGSAIRKTALGNGMRSLYEDGLERVSRGLTSEEEIRRRIKK